MDFYLSAYAVSMMLHANTPARTPEAEDAFYQQYGRRPVVLDWLLALVLAARSIRRFPRFRTARA